MAKITGYVTCSGCKLEQWYECEILIQPSNHLIGCSIVTCENPACGTKLELPPGLIRGTVARAAPDQPRFSMYPHTSTVN
jgi:hypothetical protein